MTRATGMSFLVAALVPGCGAPGQTPAQFDGEQALSYVKTQVEFGPRVPNTNGRQRARQTPVKTAAAAGGEGL